MKRVAIIAAVAALAGGGIAIYSAFFRPMLEKKKELHSAGPPPLVEEKSGDSSSRQPRKNIREGTRPKPPVPENPLPVPLMIQTSQQLNDPGGSVEEDIEIVRSLIDYHRRRLRIVPPGGENEEIVASLRGKNERKLRLIEEDHPKINSSGQLLDRYGTPYHFHSVSPTLMEIRSAGPDKELFTEDDVTLGDESGGEAFKNL